MRPAHLAVGCAVVLVSLGVQAQEAPLKFSGHYKNLALRTRTFPGEPYALDLNRLRLQLQGPMSQWFAVDLAHDSELRLEAGGASRGRHRLYRASATGSLGDVDLKAGRQRIAWGTGRFWSPLDIVNPIGPVALEREERAGIDAFLAEAKFGPLSRLSLLYVPRRDAPPDRALRWHGNARGTDYSIVVGRLADQDVFGLDVATQLGTAGLRAELTRQKPSAATAFGRAVVGIDYAFANTLTLTAELFYNGGGTRDRARYDFSRLLAGRTPALATRYAGLYVGYEITPLLKCSSHSVFNIDDSSRALDLRLAWSVRPNLDLGAGVQRFSGPFRSEFGRLPDVLFGQLQWFF
ncbi:MAG: hypothetical protein AB1430_02000 [Pseudomonadota bacterium]